MNLKRKSLFLSFCFAWIPGAGQMYLGYMKRGASLMSLFFAVWATGIMFRFEVILFVLPIVFAYSFFDTFNLRNQTPEQVIANPDEVMVFVRWINIYVLQGGSMEKIMRGRAHKLLGWACVIIGAYMTYNILFSTIVSRIIERFELWFLSDMLYYFPTLILAAALVLFGLVLLRGPRATVQPQEEYVAFKGDDIHE